MENKVGRDYLVFFKRSEHKVFSPLGEFGHVFILVKDNRCIWVGIDPCYDGLSISTLSNEEVAELKILYNYIELKNYSAHKFQLYVPMLRSCVSLVKSVLGIRGPFIWTPKQLYKYLSKV
jgi:hypothetical protein